MKLALCIPTRGIIFARTILSSVLNSELPLDTYKIIVSGLPIPQSHNECIRQALQTDCTHILFIEEDMEIPEGGFSAMAQEALKGNRIVAIDYQITPTLRCAIYDEGKPLAVGFGCTLFGRTLFEKEFTEPWLTDKYSVGIENEHPFKFNLHENPIDKPRYGKFDIYFFLCCKKLGIPITIVPNMLAKHLRVKTLERKETNKGTYDIYEL